RIVARAFALESWELRYPAYAKLEVGAQRLLPQRAADQPKPGVAGRRVGAASSTTDKAFAPAGHANHGHDPRGHGSALPRTLRHHAGRCGFGGPGRSRTRSDDLSLEPAARSPSAAARVYCRIDAEEW